jgi:hypothetical protein
MKKSEFKFLIKEVVSEMSFETDKDIELYRWIQMKLKYASKPEDIVALRKVAGMIEQEKGNVLQQDPQIMHKVD